MGTITLNGVAPGMVGSLTAGTAGANTIPVTFVAASGSAPISYSGWTSIHGGNAWTQNSGIFNSTGGTFVGLVPAVTYDLRITAGNAIGTSSTDLLLGVTTASASATSFTVALSAQSGSAGTTVSLKVTPVSGPWPPGESVSPSASGLSGTFDNPSLTGSGTNPLTFTFAPVSGPGTSGSLTAMASGMTNVSGAQPYTINAAVSNSAANRFELAMASSAGVAGSAVQVTIYPNATFPSGNIVLAGTNGSFSTGPTITLTPGSTAPVTVMYTPAAAGEHSVSATNTAGLYNPYPAPLTVFTGAAGTARTLALELTRSDMVTFQRDVASGNPSGFSLPWAKGWGEVWLNVTTLSGPTAGLFIRLYDAMSSGASPTVGSGTALHSSSVQVYGAISATGIIRVLLPAGPFIYYADVATDAAFTNPIRIAQRFRVGVVVGHFSRSQESGLSRSYAYSNNMPVPTTYPKTATWMEFDYRYSVTDCGWFLHDGVSTDPYPNHYSEGVSSGTQEIGRLLESQLGVCVGITGMSASGGGLDSLVNHDGSFAGGFADTVSSSVGSKFRYMWVATGGWDGADSTNYPTETHAEVRTRIFAAVDWIARRYPSVAVIGWVTSASGVFGSDGSRAVGYTRNQMILLSELEPINPMVVSKECYSWNEYFTGHATMAARVQYVRAGFRKLMAAEITAMGGLQTTARGPKLASTGSIKSGMRVISIPYTLPAGSALQAIGISFSNPNFTVNTATPQEIASLFAVYQPGGYQGNGQAIKIDTAMVNSGAGTIDLALTGSTGVTYADGTTGTMPSGFAVHYAADFAASNASITPGCGRAVMLTDDRVDTTNGIPHGWHMLPALDIVISTV